MRGVDNNRLEGTWNPRTLFVVEFESAEHAQAWYRSLEYASALEMRTKLLVATLIL